METPDRHTDWAWLGNTYWYVPTPDLPAPQFDPGDNTLSWLVDQTVWHIVGRRRGYIWGVTSVLLHDAGEDVPTRGPGSRPTLLTLLGTITSSGQVQLTFVPQSGTGSPTTGIGRMVQLPGRLGVRDADVDGPRRVARPSLGDHGADA